MDGSVRFVKRPNWFANDLPFETPEIAYDLPESVFAVEEEAVEPPPIRGLGGLGGLSGARPIAKPKQPSSGLRQGRSRR